MRTSTPAILYSAQSTVTGPGAIGPFDVSQYGELDVFVKCISFSGGTSPTLTVNLLAVDPWGNTYTQKTYSGLAANGTNDSIWAPNGDLKNPFGTTVQFSYTLAGSPTNCVFELTVVGR